MSLYAAVFLAVIIGIFAHGVMFGGRLPRGFRNRSCQGRGWRRAFPATSQARIRAFLQVFADAFAFDSREKLKFSPDDGVLDVYRAVYPSRWTPDALELEAFAQELEKQFGVRLESIWRDQLTLGDVLMAIETRPRDDRESAHA